MKSSILRYHFYHFHFVSVGVERNVKQKREFSFRSEFHLENLGRSQWMKRVELFNMNCFQLTQNVYLIIFLWIRWKFLIISSSYYVYVFGLLSFSFEAHDNHFWESRYLWFSLEIVFERKEPFQEIPRSIFLVQLNWYHALETFHVGYFGMWEWDEDNGKWKKYQMFEIESIQIESKLIRREEKEEEEDEEQRIQWNICLKNVSFIGDTHSIPDVRWYFLLVSISF